MRKPTPDPVSPTATATAFAGATLMKFVMSGASTAALFLLLCYGLTRAGLDPVVASPLAYATAFGVGYGLQRWWTFDGRHRHASALPRYVLLQAGCALLSGAVSRLGVAWFQFSPLPMATLTTLVTGGISFLVSRYWVFPHERSDPEQSI